MKRNLHLLLLTVFCFSQFSCTQQNSKAQQEEDLFNEMKKAGVNSQVRKDTIFLNYIFGMSSAEFDQHSKVLLKKKKLYYDNENILTYDMVIANSGYRDKAKATFSPEFHNDSLYRIGVSVKSEETSDPKLTQLRLVSLLRRKYGLNDFEEEALLTECKNYYWVEENLLVEVICGISDARIFYTDLSLQDQIQNAREREIEKKYQNTKSDL